MAKHMQIQFKARNGYIWWFSKRQGIENRCTFNQILKCTCWIDWLLHHISACSGVKRQHPCRSMGTLQFPLT
jgi:hypothetical protein